MEGGLYKEISRVHSTVKTGEYSRLREAWNSSFQPPKSKIKFSFWNYYNIRDRDSIGNHERGTNKRITKCNQSKNGILFFSLFFLSDDENVSFCVAERD